MDCVCCGYVIPNTEQFYNIADVCTDIVTIIEQQVGQEIDVEAVLCQECFENSIETLQGNNNNFNTNNMLDSNDSNIKTTESKGNDSGIETLESDENNSAIESVPSKEIDSVIEKLQTNKNISVAESQDPNETDYVLESSEANENNSLVELLEVNENDSVSDTLESKDDDSDIEIVECIPTCVWCQTSLDKKLCYSLREGPQRNAIILRISPREIPSDAQVCSSCWVQACRVVGANKDIAANIMDVCILCKSSLEYRRSHSIPEGAERKKIALRIAPQKIYACSKICHICWISIKINLVNGTSKPKDPGICVVCSMSLSGKLTHMLPQGTHRKIILKKTYPRQVTGNSLLCQECWLSTLNSIPHRQVQTSLRLRHSHNKTTNAANQKFHTWV